MNIKVDVPIDYHSDPIDPDMKTIHYKHTYSNVDNEYEKGTLLPKVMQDLAKYLKTKLPEKALIANLNGVEYVWPIDKIAEGLMRNDDQMAKNLFTEKTVTKVKNSKSSKATDTEKKTKKQTTTKTSTNQTDQNISLLLDVCLPGKQTYNRYNLINGVPSDDSLIRKIGDTVLPKPVKWQKISKLILNNLQLIANNHLGSMPNKPTVTQEDRENIAKSCGYEAHDFDNWPYQPLGKYDDNKYQLIVFKQLDSDNKQEIARQKLNTAQAKANKREPESNKPKQTDKPKKKNKGYFHFRLNGYKSIPDSKAYGTTTNNMQKLSTQSFQTMTQNKHISAFAKKGMNSMNNNQNQMQTNNNQAQSKKSYNQDPWAQPYTTDDKVLSICKDMNKKLDGLKKDLQEYQKTANTDYYLAMLNQEMKKGPDKIDVSQNVLNWIKTLKTTKQKASGIYTLVTALPKHPEISNSPELFLLILQAIIHND